MKSSNILFSEAIKLNDGIFYNLPLHIARINRTTQNFYNREIDLSALFHNIPDIYKKGLYKFRIVYSTKIISVEYIPYTFRTIKSIGIVKDDTIDYSFKYADRNQINALLAASGYDEIIIVKNGLVTDASSSNLVFENEEGLFTPSTYLLKGTKRDYLLEKGIIKEKRISLKDISLYSNVYLINAMIDLDDKLYFPIENIEMEI